ncbi:MAG: putative thioredoxin [Actinomycetota bacterium]|jgi:putative thioredoxin|nr:putative thioredoxin [Actinomycetota bacterium]
MGATEQHVVEVTEASFEEVVIQGSKTRPVIVDLWAEWCGPCKTLGPVLEKVAGERDGAFLLAKLDVDANPAVASAFGVQSIPTVVAFRDGEAVTGFVGAYPEPEVNRFVDSILPTEAEMIAEDAHALEEAGDLEQAEQDYRDALAADPDNRDAAVGLARILVERGEDEAARTLIRPHLPDPAAERVEAAIRVRNWANEPPSTTLGEAKALAAQGKWREALDGMLEALREDRDGTRAAMLDVFAVLGDDDQLVPAYRRRLTNALF